MSTKRIVYIAQMDEKLFQVTFHTAANSCPNRIVSRKVRTYYQITQASLDRLNRLVYLRPAVKISAHLSPYICLWVTFPAKVKRHV